MAESEPVNILRRLLPYTTVVLIAAALYAGWTMWSRWDENRRVEAEAHNRELQRDAEVTRRLGDTVRIMGFYSSPAAVKKGERALICYSVANAKTVRIEPPIEPDLKPSLSRCLEVHPTSETRYTLTAEDAQGKQVHESFVFHVLK